MKHLKQEFDKLTFKEVIVFILAVITMIAGLTMLFLGMFIAPQGEIHGSVLTAFGTICLFVASLLGISIHYANELTKFKSQAMGMVQNLANAQSNDQTETSI